ncbi:DUF416 family protein [Actinomadura sp. HBU206391]|uniref:DUF416 family protein n=1 Tax=Actinomadura sp. HBU206391 TaxID=2731692 RepID=UPI0016502C40|nr:DUF416 family protein [Actinomadura sp. HBU206391]MBC6463573.1 DUF416 family protein [Actinomadura sp. HBU206391]
MTGRHPDGESDAARLARWVSEPERLTTRLDGLDPSARAALAASVADRLLPNYLRFHEHTGRGEPSVLRRALDDVWNRLHHGSPIDIVPLGVDCLEQTPLGPDNLADFSTVVTGNAVYAVWAVTGALHCAVHGRVLEVVHCLRYGRSIAMVIASARSDGTEPGRAELQDPLVQREVRRQLLDLEALETVGPTTETLAWLRRSTTDP